MNDDLQKFVDSAFVEDDVATELAKAISEYFEPSWSWGDEKFKFVAYFPWSLKAMLSIDLGTTRIWYSMVHAPSDDGERVLIEDSISFGDPDYIIKIRKALKLDHLQGLHDKAQEIIKSYDKRS